MPFYTLNEALPDTIDLRAGLDALRLGRYKLAAELGKLQQMTAAQAESQYGFVDLTAATDGKAELEADIAKLLSDATGVNSAVVQMLNQFG